MNHPASKGKSEVGRVKHIILQELAAQSATGNELFCNDICLCENWFPLLVNLLSLLLNILSCCKKQLGY